MTARDDSDGLARRVMRFAQYGGEHSLSAAVLARAVVEWAEAKRARERADAAFNDAWKRDPGEANIEWSRHHDRLEAAEARLLLLAGGAGT